jgi:hypothetical protein
VADSFDPSEEGGAEDRRVVYKPPAAGRGEPTTAGCTAMKKLRIVILGFWHGATEKGP